MNQLFQVRRFGTTGMWCVVRVGRDGQRLVSPKLRSRALAREARRNIIAHEARDAAFQAMLDRVAG